METEQYFKCPICGKKVVKSKGQKYMWRLLCEECYHLMQYVKIKLKENNSHDKERTA